MLIKVIGGDTMTRYKQINSFCFLSSASFRKIVIVLASLLIATCLGCGGGGGQSGQAASLNTNTQAANTQTPAAYRVIYDGNGATGGAAPADSTSYKQGQTATVQGNAGKLVKDGGYSFAGWNTSADGNGTAYSPGGTFQIASNITLYAAWTPYKLLQRVDLAYQGAFRVPYNASLQYSGSTLAYNPTGFSNSMCAGAGDPYSCCTGAGTGSCPGGGSLFMLGSNPENFAEISIPAPECLDGTGAVVSCSGYSMPGTPTANVKSLNQGSLIQAATDITHGNAAKIGANGGDLSCVYSGTCTPCACGSGGSCVSYSGYHGSDGEVGTGLLVYNGQLIGDSKIFYDADYCQELSHFTTSLDLSADKFSGYYKLGGGLPKQGFTAGPMGTVPPGYQAQLGGEALTGQGNFPIMTDESVGPCAISFHPSGLTPSNISSTVAANALVYYTVANPLPAGTGSLGASDAWGDPASDAYTSASDRINGVAFPENTRSVLFFGTHGTDGVDGYSCYGMGTTSLTQAYTDGCPGGVGSCDPAKRTPYNNFHYCYDPTVGGTEGTHDYPYVNYVWAYDVGDPSGNNTKGNNVKSLSTTDPDRNNLTAVKLGYIKPWEVLPYAKWAFPLPTGSCPNGYACNFEGAAFDPSSGLIYVAQENADAASGTYFPLIHVFAANSVSP